MNCNLHLREASEELRHASLSGETTWGQHIANLTFRRQMRQTKRRLGQKRKTHNNVANSCGLDTAAVDDSFQHSSQQIGRVCVLQQSNGENSAPHAEAHGDRTFHTPFLARPIAVRTALTITTSFGDLGGEELAVSARKSSEFVV